MESKEACFNFSVGMNKYVTVCACMKEDKLEYPDRQQCYKVLKWNTISSKFCAIGFVYSLLTRFVSVQQKNHCDGSLVPLAFTCFCESEHFVFV